MYNRISNHEVECKTMSAAQTANMTKDGMTVGMNCFTVTGYPKAVPMALA